MEVQIRRRPAVSSASPKHHKKLLQASEIIALLQQIEVPTFQDENGTQHVYDAINSQGRKDRASAPSRGVNECYNGGDKDSLWSGGRGVVPAELSRRAAGGGGGEDGDDRNGLGGSGGGDDGGGGSGGGGGGGGWDDTEVQTQSKEEKATYFLPGTGIDREVITTDICRYLGPDALAKPGAYMDPRRGPDASPESGFFVQAYRSLTVDQLTDIKADSLRWIGERTRNSQMNRQNGSDGYRASATRARQQDQPSPYAPRPTTYPPQDQGREWEHSLLNPLRSNHERFRRR